jgi:tetratricopeptide (TPR) repeat protein
MTFYKQNKFFTIVSLCIIGCAILLLYSFSFQNGFVDDDHGIETVALNDNFINPSSPVFLRGLLYQGIYNVFGLSPVAFRLPNILFHIANYSIVFLLLFKISKSKLTLPVVLLFALHPIVTESVGWISGGIYPQMTFFFLCSFVIFLYVQSNSNNTNMSNIRTSLLFYLLSTIFYIFSLFTSEKAVVFAPLYLIFFLLIHKKNTWIISLPYIILAGILFFLRIQLLGNRISYIANEFASKGTAPSAFQFISFVLARYTSSTLLPINLSVFQTKNAIFMFPINVWLIIGISLMFIGFILSEKKHKQWFLFFFFLTLFSLIPPNLPFLRPTPAALRYMYLPLIGITGMVLFSVTFIKNKYATIFFYTISSITIILFCNRTINRLSDYKNELSWRLAGVRDAPDNPDAHNFLGGLYLDTKQFDKAKGAFIKANSINPYYLPPIHNLGLIAQNENNQKEAIEWFQKALEISPTSWKSYMSLAISYATINDYEHAIYSCDEAIKITPNDSSIYVLRGSIYMKMGNTQNAKEDFQKAIEINPKDSIAQERLRMVNQ